MTVQDIHKIIERWAPSEIAWERDNAGLQIGSFGSPVKAIEVCLDVDEQIIREAKDRRANLIISHHPLLFRPLRSVNLRDGIGRCVEQLLRSKISLYAAHTNLDFARGGTSFALADKLGLINVDFLHKSYKLKKKIVTFVPPDSVERVADAMGKAGAGRIGNYDACSFRGEGVGTFEGNSASNPTIGQRGKPEQCQEIRLEMVTDQMNIRSVINALLDSHPYEEAAYDVYPLENVSQEYGMGVIGQLPRPLSSKRFLSHVKQALKTASVRHTEGATHLIRTVAACGGSGSDLTDEALRQGADAFITADVKYHSFQDAAHRIMLVDAGHYETERPVVDVLVKKLKQELEDMNVRIPVHACRVSTNPIVYH